MTFEKLEDIALVTPGTSPKGDLINSIGLGLPFFQGSKEFNELYPVPERYTEHPVKVANRGDVLISVRAPVGEVNIAREDCSIGRGVMSVRAKKKSEQMFIFYFLKNLQGKWDSLGSTGSVFENLSAVALNNVTVPFGLNREAIGEILFNIDKKIATNNALSKTLEDIAQVIFKSWFIDFDPVKAKMAGKKPAGMDAATAALFPDSMEESELGLIPKGWEVKVISDFGKVVTGKTPSTKVPEFWGGNIPFVTIPDMHSQLLVTSTTRALSQEGANSQRSQYIPAGSTMVTCIATPGLVGYATKNCQTNQQINSVIPNFEQTSIWLFWHLRGLIPTLIRNSGIGTVFANLNKSDFSNIKSITPDMPLRDAFSQISEPIMELLTTTNYESQYLRDIRNTLIPRLISGELQILEEMLAS